MDYEQKYKDALAWVESIYPKLNHEHQMEAETFFPELAESEDERIRKALTEGLCDVTGELGWSDFGGIPIEEILSWLEKQGTSYTKRDVDDAFVEGMAFVKDELEKQGKQILANFAKTCKDEQKPAWSEEDDDYFNDVIAFLEDARDCRQNALDCIDWMGTLKQRLGG